MSGGWDCHAHLFGPYDRFPLASDRSYTPPEAVEQAFLQMLERLGLTHGVLVHPSAYGDDFSLLLSALGAHPRLRGVVVARPETFASVGGLRERGVRALRFSHRSGGGTNFAGSASFSDLATLTSRIADEGLHAELWTDTRALPEIAPAIRRLPFPLVIDHMGGFEADRGLDDPGFRTLLSLLEDGCVWVKLCVYRNLPNDRDLEHGKPFHDAMIDANPDQLVWGSDWPHLRVDPAPATVELLSLFKRWVADDGLVARILEANPTRLYG